MSQPLAKCCAHVIHAKPTTIIRFWSLEWGILSKRGSPVATTVHASLHENLGEGFVWLGKKGLPPRCVVKITNSENHRHVFCEALQFDANFLSRYNSSPNTRCIDEPETSVVMSYWYRAKLGDRDKSLESATKHKLQIAMARSWTRWWWGKLHACWHHPQLAIRVAAWLALLSVSLGFVSFSWVAGPWLTGLFSRPKTIPASANSTTSTASVPLTINDFLAWRTSYGDLLGKPREAVVERFGNPERDEGTTLSWDPSPKTKGHAVSVFFESVAKTSTATALKVFAGTGESLDPTEVLKKATMFTFSTGTYKDTVKSYFVAETKDERNTFQFDVSEDGVKFRAMMFANK